ncbi:unnamed protein product, partial [Didymodactylos carnosus]
WCPVEDDGAVPNLVSDALNFTVFVKNFIEFPMFNVIRKNIVDNMKTCVYDPDKNKECPIFRLKDIIDTVETDLDEREQMLKTGAVIRIKLEWNCNFDYEAKRCKPKYSFGRLDARLKEEAFSFGFNFRFASHWKRSKRYYRTLTKAFGLRLIISVSGHASKFDFITLTLNIGSLIGVFGLATFICDIVMLNFCKQADLYRQCIFQRVHISTLENSTTVDSNVLSSRYSDTSVDIGKININFKQKRSKTDTNFRNTRPFVIDTSYHQRPKRQLKHQKSTSLSHIIP